MPVDASTVDDLSWILHVAENTVHGRTSGVLSHRAAWAVFHTRSDLGMLLDELAEAVAQQDARDRAGS